MWMQKKLGFGIPVFFGRALTGGVLHKLFGWRTGIFPYRTPIHSVVGEALEVPKVKDEDITQELLDEWHKKYVDSLKALEAEWRPKFDQEKKARLEELEKDKERKELLKESKLREKTKSMKVVE